jgi:hypothetical protein
VTGYLFRNGDQQLPENNQFDRAVTPLPAPCTSPEFPPPPDCVNYQDNNDVIITNDLIEFATTNLTSNPGAFEVDTLDVSTFGVVQVQAFRPGNQFVQSQYILKSRGFPQFSGVQILASSGLPDGVSVTLGGAEFLADNAFVLDIPSFTLPSNEFVNIRLSFLLVSCLAETAWVEGLGHLPWG